MYENRTLIVIGIIRSGSRLPSIQEAEQFLAGDIAKIGGRVLGVYPINRRDAEWCYDFSYEEQWPVFGS